MSYVETQRIDHHSVRELCAKHLTMSETDLDTCQQLARFSDIIFAYFWQDKLLAIAGFVPTAAIADTAYIWMQTCPEAHNHKLAVGRWGIYTLREVRKRYSRIIGHCVFGSRSITWLRSLGAKFNPPENGRVSFVIGDIP